METDGNAEDKDAIKVQLEKILQTQLKRKVDHSTAPLSVSNTHDDIHQHGLLVESDESEQLHSQSTKENVRLVDIFEERGTCETETDENISIDEFCPLLSPSYLEEETWQTETHGNRWEDEAVSLKNLVEVSDAIEAEDNVYNFYSNSKSSTPYLRPAPAIPVWSEIPRPRELDNENISDNKIEPQLLTQPEENINSFSSNSKSPTPQLRYVRPAPCIPVSSGIVRSRETCVKDENFIEREVAALLLTESSLIALEVGLAINYVKQAIREHVKQSGSGFDSSDDLIDAILLLQEKQNQEHVIVPPTGVNEDVMQAYLRTKSALAALHMGISLTQVKEAIRVKLENTGSGFSCSDALVEAALNIVEEEQQVDQATVEVIKDEFQIIEENRLLKEEKQCKICMDAHVGIVFIPCGHLVTCVDCSKTVKNCPVCRADISSSVKAYLS